MAKKTGQNGRVLGRLDLFYLCRSDEMILEAISDEVREELAVRGRQYLLPSISTMSIERS